MSLAIIIVSQLVVAFKSQADINSLGGERRVRATLMNSMQTVRYRNRSDDQVSSSSFYKSPLTGADRPQWRDLRERKMDFMALSRYISLPVLYSYCKTSLFVLLQRRIRGQVQLRGESKCWGNGKERKAEWRRRNREYLEGEKQAN